MCIENLQSSELRLKKFVEPLSRKRPTQMKTSGDHLFKYELSNNLLSMFFLSREFNLTKFFDATCFSVRILIQNRMFIRKFALVFIIVTLQAISASLVNDEECDEQVFALMEAIVTKQFWALKRQYSSH